MRMRCRWVVGRLGAYAEGELPREQREAVRLHLEGCAACRREAEGLARVERALGGLAAMEPASELLEDLHRRLGRAQGRPVRWRWQWALGAAAVGAVVVWLSVGPAERPDRAPVAAQAERQGPRVQAEGTAAPAVEAEGRRDEGETREQESAKVEAREVRHAMGQRKGSSGPTVVAAEASQPEQSEEREVGPEPTAVEARQPAEGVILLLGEPRVRPTSDYYAEMSFPDGTKTIREQRVVPAEGGRPPATEVSYQVIAANGEGPQEGGQGT